MSGFPRIPIHCGDYLKDTLPVCRANWEHHGIYLLALILTWSTPRCRLPNDKKWLAARFGCSLQEFEMFIKPVLKLYFKNDGHWWRQKRLSRENLYVKKQSSSAKSRWRKEKTPMPKSILAYAPTPTPTHKKEESLNSGFEEKRGQTHHTQNAKEGARQKHVEEQIAERTAGPPKTERGRAAAKAWLERRGLPPGMEPLYKSATALNGLGPPAFHVKQPDEICSDD